MRLVKYLFVFFISVSFILGCGNKSNRSTYLTVVVPYKQDTTGMYRRIQHMEKYGMEYQFVEQDTAEVINLISKPIIKLVKQSIFVKNVQDLTNSDSAIIVVELELRVDKMEAEYDI